MNNNSKTQKTVVASKKVVNRNLNKKVLPKSPSKPTVSSLKKSNSGLKQKVSNIELRKNDALNSVSNSINKFSLNFYIKFRQTNTCDFVISPFAIYYILHLFYSCTDTETKCELEKILKIKKEDIEKPFFESIKDVFTNHFKMENSVVVVEKYLLDHFKQIIKLDYDSLLIEDSFELKKQASNDSNILMILTNVLKFEYEFKSEKCLSATDKYLFVNKPFGLPLEIYELVLKEDVYALDIIFVDDINIENKLFQSINYFNNVMNEMKPVDNEEIKKMLALNIKINNSEMNFMTELIGMGFESLNTCENDVPCYGLNVNEANVTSLMEIDSNKVSIKCKTKFDLKRNTNCNDISNQKQKSNTQISNLSSVIFLIRNIHNKLILFMGKYQK